MTITRFEALGLLPDREYVVAHHKAKRFLKRNNIAQIDRYVRRIDFP